ncbi:MAG: MFS transporter [Anaerolineae bacterium]|nr:MFS transporter [Anaerolineae bacterium]
MSNDPETLPPHYRRNFAALLVDYFTFGIAMNFFNPNSLLPAFVGELTNSALVIGSVSSVFSGSWLLPQLIAARIINDKPRKKPYLLGGLSGRVMFWIIALGLGLGLGQKSPAAMLALFFTCLTAWAISDGIASVAWFEIMAGAIPSKRRGRLLGTAQVLSGLGGIGAGVLIGQILTHLSFPDKYTLTFALASTLLIPSTIALFTLREVPSEAIPEATSEPAEKEPRLKRLIAWLRVPFTNPAFRHLMICRIMVGMMGLATPFYVQHATKELLLPQGVVGNFVIAQTIAGVAASAVLGWVCERWGTRYVIRIGSAAAILGPLFALATHLASDRLAPAYPLAYVFLGIINSAWVMGFFNYLLEIAPGGMRPTYIGISNFVMGTLTLVPMLGGWLLETTSYTILFGTATALVTAGFLLSLSLKPSLSITPTKAGS